MTSSAKRSASRAARCRSSRRSDPPASSTRRLRRRFDEFGEIVGDEEANAPELLGTGISGEVGGLLDVLTSRAENHFLALRARWRQAEDSKSAEIQRTRERFASQNIALRSCAALSKKERR
jgi:hypothetical protein